MLCAWLWVWNLEHHIVAGSDSHHVFVQQKERKISKCLHVAYNHHMRVASSLQRSIYILHCIVPYIKQWTTIRLYVYVSFCVGPVDLFHHVHEQVQMHLLLLRIMIWHQVRSGDHSFWIAQYHQIVLLLSMLYRILTLTAFERKRNWQWSFRYGPPECQPDVVWYVDKWKFIQIAKSMMICGSRNAGLVFYLVCGPCHHIWTWRFAWPRKWLLFTAMITIFTIFIYWRPPEYSTTTTNGFLRSELTSDSRMVHRFRINTSTNHQI